MAVLKYAPPISSDDEEPESSSSPPKPAPKPANLPIRTMRDDVREAGKPHTSKESAPAQSTQPTFQAPVPPPTPPSPQSVGESAATPKPPQTPSRPTPPPPPPKPDTPKKKPDRLLVILIAVFVVSALAAGGVWAWIFFAPDTTPEMAVVEDVAEPQTLTEMIPSNSLLVAYYQLADSAQRLAVSDVWQTGEDPTTLESLSGDPRLFLSLPSVQQFAYVLLPGDPRLYVVIEGSQELDQLLAERSNVQVLEMGQWRILHSFSTDLYVQALAAGSRADAGENITSFGGDVTLYTSGELLTQLHDRVGVVANEGTDFILSLALAREGTDVVARFATQPADTSSPGPAVNLESLLAAVPADATFMRAGQSFADQAFRVPAPAGSELVTSLTEPYVYYERLGDDGSLDAGVVTSIPPGLQESLAVPDSTIEATLPLLHAAANLGSAPAAELAFTDTVYANVPVRYVNINTPQLSLDYARLGTILALATSQEGMEQLVDVSQQTQANANTTWGTLEKLSRDIGSNRAFGFLTQPAVKRLLPGGEAAASLPFAAVFDASAGSLRGVAIMPAGNTE